jgi:hypothetical protein
LIQPFANFVFRSERLTGLSSLVGSDHVAEALRFLRREALSLGYMMRQLGSIQPSQAARRADCRIELQILMIDRSQQSGRHRLAQRLRL